MLPMPFAAPPAEQHGAELCLSRKSACMRRKARRVLARPRQSARRHGSGRAVAGRQSYPLQTPSLWSGLRKILEVHVALLDQQHVVSTSLQGVLVALVRNDLQLHAVHGAARRHHEHPALVVLSRQASYVSVELDHLRAVHAVCDDGTGQERPGRAPGQCGCAVTSLLQRYDDDVCGGAVC
jgi:hypothetical protein